jgi:uncharacterized membrane protein
MSKRAIVINAVHKVRSSYWFLPTVLALAAVVAAEFSLYLDQNPSSIFNVWPQAWTTTQVDGARATLSVIAQSVLGVAGVMFSVTIVAVSFASGNFGPRLIGNFMRDRGTQWSLGILIGTFVFALLILRSIHSADDTDGASLQAFVPHMSVGIAMTFMGVSIVTVIFYVHHIPETINVSNISSELGRKLRHALTDLIDKRHDTDAADNLTRPDRDADHEICLGRDGYVQTFDERQLTTLAEKHDLYIQIAQDVGSFVNTYTVMLKVWGDIKADSEIPQALTDCFVVGSTPTEDQNLLFVVQQLVEMIARALSPGVNDPYTAINCLNWIYSGLATASNYKGGLDQARFSRVIYQTLGFGDIFEHGVVQVYPYVKTDPLANAHLKDTLERLLVEMTPRADADIVRDFLNKMEDDDTPDTR